MLMTKIYTFVVKNAYYLQGSIIIPMMKRVISGDETMHLGEKYVRRRIDLYKLT